MELNDLLNQTSPCTVKYRNFEFVCQIYTEILTPTYKARLLALAVVSNEQPEGQNDADVPVEVKDEHAKMLADLIASWTDKDGEPIVLKGEYFPPTYENWLQLSYSMLASFIKQITQHLADTANPQNEPA